MPLWLRRKRHTVLQTPPIDDDGDQDIGPDVLHPDDFPMPFDPNDTLPQIWESDPDATLPYMLGDDTSDDTGLEAVADITSMTPSGDPVLPSEPRQTRTGRQINIPVRYRE